MKRSLPAAAAAAAAALVLSACGAENPDTAQSAEDTTDASLDVAAAFYPLQLAVERIGGDRVAVTSLTTPGSEPHDVELTPREVGGLTSADLVVHLSGFQPAIDDAVETTTPEAAFDVAEHADLTIAATDDGQDHSGETEEEHDAHTDEDGTDPHFWLDPTRYASVAEAIADRLAELDPEGAGEYVANATEFTAELAALDVELSTTLATCTHRDLVTGHAAFGYLADRYDLTQVGIAGLSPDLEPSAAQIRDLVEHVRESGVTTVYAETLVSPALTETIAREADARVAVLDPIEGLTDASAGDDYFEVMRTNLETLRQGQGCA